MLADTASGVAAYLAGVKAQREQREEWHPNYERQQRLRAIAQGRAERSKAARVLSDIMRRSRWRRIILEAFGRR